MTGSEDEAVGQQAGEPNVAGSEQTPMPFSEFLQNVPPSKKTRVSDLTTVSSTSAGQSVIKIRTPDLLLPCDHSVCGGERTFRFGHGSTVFYRNSLINDTFLIYVCSNCSETEKRYSISAKRDKSSSDGTVYKYGERPPFGPNTPTRLLRMFGNDRETFLRGRRCESQGLGIGAFTYYRRVVENRKNEILDEIRIVSERVGASKEVISNLEQAKSEVSFKKAIEPIKEAIPQSLLINGHNPLTLLHSALSVGVHDKTDEECLDLAHDIRVVLADLADRLSQALKDEEELSTAVSRLLASASKKRSRGSK